jgi:hypothetical protein
MKKIILVLTIGLLFISCSSDSNNSTSLGLYKWRCKINGVLYEWEGNHLTGGGPYAVGGQSTYSMGSLALQKLNSGTTNGSGITVSAQFPNNTTGNFVCNSSQPFSIIITDGNPQNPQGTISYSTQFGGTMNVNITSISNDSFVTNPQNPGKVIGTFSGTIGKYVSTSPPQITTSVVTEGSFEAVKAQ